MSDDFVPFNIPAVLGREPDYLQQVLASGRFAGDGPFTARCSEWLRERFGAPAVLMTNSCTGALEMAATLCDLKPGDEVILPSFAFTSTGLAFVRAGGALRFVDVDPDTMNIDPAAIAAAVTPATRVIVVLHYAGVACDMDAICGLARMHDLMVVEDAAHAAMARFGDRHLGTLGTFGCLSFHESKNLHCGEGGALIINDADHVTRAEILLEKGTDRRRYFRGEINAYSWQDLGSSYVPSELSSAFLLAQLEQADAVTSQRRAIWDRYHRLLEPLVEPGRLELPHVPDEAFHNGHICWLKTSDADKRVSLQTYLAARGICSHSHYVPLHNAPAGRRYGHFCGSDRVTKRDAPRLLRLPIHHGFDRMRDVVDVIKEWVARQSA